MSRNSRGGLLQVEVVSLLQQNQGRNLFCPRWGRVRALASGLGIILYGILILLLVFLQSYDDGQGRPTAMYYKLAFATLAVIIGNEFVSAQQIPSTTTAAELWNPWTWFWPYAKASAEAYRDYFEKAQKATNELYQQVYKTNAFPWITGNWSFLQPTQGDTNGQINQAGNVTQLNQEENSEQANQKNPAQQNQENPSQTNEKGNDQTEEKGEENPVTEKTSPDVQVQGGVDDDGNADAEINTK